MATLPYQVLWTECKSILMLLHFENIVENEGFIDSKIVLFILTWFFEDRVFKKYFITALGFFELKLY